jgi:hypothetical protein
LYRHDKYARLPKISKFLILGSMESSELPDQKSRAQKVADPTQELARRFADELNRLLPEIVNRELVKAVAPVEHGQNHTDAAN